MSIRNCRRFHKRHYTLKRPADRRLLDLLDCFGFAEVFAASRFIPSGLDIFKIKLETAIEIAGAIGSDELQITVSKQMDDTLDEIERTLQKWYAGTP